MLNDFFFHEINVLNLDGARCHKARKIVTLLQTIIPGHVIFQKNNDLQQSSFDITPLDFGELFEGQGLF